MTFLDEYVLSPPIEAHAAVGDEVGDTLNDWGLAVSDAIQEQWDRVWEVVPDNPGTQFLKWGVNSFWNVVDRVLGFDEYSPDIAINYNNVMIGTAYYDYLDISTGQTTTITGNYNFFPSAIRDGYQIFRSSKVNVTAKYEPRTDQTPTQSPALKILTTGYYGYSINPGDFYSLYININGYDVFHTPYRYDYMGVYTNSTYKYNSEGAQLNGFAYFARMGSVQFTTNQSVANSYKSAQYIPGGNYTYDDYVQQLVNNYNTQYPEETLTPSDLPSADFMYEVWNDEGDPEPTEPGQYGPGLTKEELYEVLTTEDYDMDQLHTNPTYDDPDETVYILESMPDFYSSDIQDMMHGDADIGLGPDYEDLDIFYVMAQTTGGLGFWTDSAVHLMSGSVLGFVLVIVIINFILDKFSD